MDLNQKRSGSTSPASEGAAGVKSCADCETTKTPLWRSGPAGPRSLCNACGIRHRKQRRAVVGPGKGGSEKIGKKNGSKIKGGEIGMSMKLALVELGRREMELQRWWGSKEEKKLREEEEAAMLLMALSCGSVFA